MSRGRNRSCNCRTAGFYIIVHWCNSNSTTQPQQGTMDMVPLKVDESVLMDDSSLAHKMNPYFSSLFTTEDDVNLSYTLVGCLLTRNLYILMVLLVLAVTVRCRQSASSIYRAPSVVLVKSKLLTKAWGQDGWMLSKFFSSCLLTETESRSAIGTGIKRTSPTHFYKGDN